MLLLLQDWDDVNNMPSKSKQQEEYINYDACDVFIPTGFQLLWWSEIRDGVGYVHFIGPLGVWLSAHPLPLAYKFCS